MSELSDRLSKQLPETRARMLSWPQMFEAELSSRLADPVVAQDIDRMSYVDSWRRIRRTTPMILRTIERLDSLGEPEAATFWIEHLDEEAGHDRIMLDDLERMFGGQAALASVLDAHPITPPSAALLGYYEWQALHGDPHLLIILRLFLEWHMAEMSAAERADVHALIVGGSQTLTVHAEADRMHVRPCYAYIDRWFAPAALPRLLWSLDFIGLCLREAQAWTASAVLARSD
jgi:hypothetical protein